MTNIDPLKNTSLDYAILGLLRHDPMTGYAIRKEFETTALGHFSSSPGAIYPALNRLQKKALIEKVKTDPDGKYRFRCTSLGIEVLRAWFHLPLNKKDVTHNLNELLLKFGFMGDMIEVHSVLDFLNSFHDLLKNYLSELQQFHQSETFKDLPLHGKIAFEHGLMSYRTTLKWCKKSIQLIQNQMKNEKV